MTTDEAVQHFARNGRASRAAVARALGISRKAVAKWGPYPPPGRQFELEVLTEGALKAEPTLRPSAEVEPVGT